MPGRGMGATMVILRTSSFGERERRFLEDAGADGTVGVAVAVDETRAPVDVGRYAKIAVTRPACEKLGLHCPVDFTWRNGDYCLYLAHHQFPEVKWFWMVEPDVEHSFDHFGEFIARFDQVPGIDFLSGHLHPAEPGWHWGGTVRGGKNGVYRCFFPLIRMTARAVQACWMQRRRARFSLRSQLYWANDEAFVANAVRRAGLQAADLNSLGSPVYAADTFGYVPLDGDDGGFRQEKDRVYHPVLYGAAYQRRVARIAGATNSLAGRVGRKLQRMI